MVMKSAFNIQAKVAAGVAFQIHQVVATFQIRNARNESQNSLPFSPCAMWPSIKSRGTKPMNINGAMPQVGHAAVSSPPDNRANTILRVFIVFSKNSGKGTIFCPIFAQIFVR